MVDNSKNENFDQLRNLLNEVEITPSENLWSKIEAGLDKVMLGQTTVEEILRISLV